eukprot:jgi/Chrzof1/364/Cz01g13070.t1
MGHPVLQVVLGFTCCSHSSVLLAYGASLNATDENGKTPFNITRGYPTCQANATDGSDCPKTCAVLKNGITADQARVIQAGKLLNDESRDARWCCKYPMIADREYSQCCI